MELRQYLGIALKWWWLVVIAVLIAAGSSYYASTQATPLYQTKTTLMVGQLIQSSDPNSSQFYTAQQLAATYAQLATREPVLKGVVEALGWEINWSDLSWQISAQSLPQTQLLEIHVIDSDPFRAKVLADTIAQQLIQLSPSGVNNVSFEQLQFTQDQLADLKEKITAAEDEIERLKVELDAANSARLIQELESQINVQELKITDWQTTYARLLSTVEGGEVNALNIIEEAIIPSVPFSPNTQMNVLLAAAIGLILAVGGIFVIEYFDDTVKGTEDIIKATGLPVLGKIGRIAGKDYPTKLLALHQPESPEVEAFRGVAVNMQPFLKNGGPKCILVASPSPREGKSLITANLAVVLAQAGWRVVLVDADLRKPKMQMIFELPNKSGLREALLDETPGIDKYLQSTKVDCLNILTSGESTNNPSMLFSSLNMKRVVDELRSSADVVLFDSPPSLVVADAGILAALVDSVVIIADAGHTRPSDARRVMEDFQQVHKNIRGVILNRHKETSRNYHYYRYYSDRKPGKNGKISGNHHNLEDQPNLLSARTTPSAEKEEVPPISPSEKQK